MAMTKDFRFGLLGAVIASGLVVGGMPSLAWAARPSREEMTHFKQLVKEGSELRDSGNPWKALAKFEQAQKILDHPKLAFNIGKLHQQTGACDKAREEFRQVLARPRLDDALRVEVVAKLEESDQCKPHATLRITCVPTNTTLKVGSHNLTCPLRSKIKPGKFQIVARADGYKKQAFGVDLAPGDLLEKQVKLRKGAGAQAANDSQQGEQSPTPDDAAAKPAEPGPGTPWTTWASYGAMGVGGALLVGGVISDYTAQSRAEDFVAANNAGDRGRAASLKADADSAQTRTIVLYASGALLAAGGVALWAIESGSETDQGAQVRTEVGVNTAGPTVRAVVSW